MRRGAIAAVIAAVAVGAGGAQAAPEPNYAKYAKVRDQVRACVLDKQYRHLGREKRLKCREYRKLYRLYSYYGSADMLLWCLTSKCPPAPPHEESPRTRPPSNAIVFIP